MGRGAPKGRRGRAAVLRGGAAGATGSLARFARRAWRRATVALTRFARQGGAFVCRRRVAAGSCAGGRSRWFLRGGAACARCPCGQGFGLDGPCGVPADSAGRARGKQLPRGVPADSDRAATALARGNSFRAVIAPRALASARVRARNGRRPRCVSRRRSSLRAYAAARGGMSEPVLARLGVLAQQHHHFEGHRVVERAQIQTDGPLHLSSRYTSVLRWM